MDRVFLINLLLALAWSLLTGLFTPVNLLLGFIISYLVLSLTASGVGLPLIYLRKVRQLPAFIVFFLFELMKANLRVARQAISIRLTVRPGIVAVPLDAKSDIEITLLANLITLTPGTLSVDVSDDRRTLYVHSMNIDSICEFRRGIKDKLEKPLLELLR